MIESTDSLADAIRAAGITRTAQVYALALRLTPAEAALFSLLFESDAPMSSYELRRAGAGTLGNLSLVARTLNAKLAAAGDTRRAVHSRAFGGAPGSVSFWSLSEPEAGAA
jgi:hypothetical protein